MLVALWATVVGCGTESSSNDPARETETNPQQGSESRRSTNGDGVTGTVTAEGRIPGTLPKSAESEDPGEPIVVTLRSFGEDNEKCRFSVGEKHAVDQAELEKLLGKFAGNDMKERPIVIRADTTTRWKYIVEVFNAVVKIGFPNIAFETYEKSNGEE